MTRRTSDAEATRDVPGTPSFRSSPSWLLAAAGKVVLQRWTGMLDDLDLTPSQYKVLLTLDEMGPLGQQRLADLIGVDPRNAVSVIDASVRQGLVIRDVDPGDRRRRVLGLSPQGADVTTTLRTLNADIEAELLDPVSPDGRTVLIQTLQAVLATQASPTAGR